MLHSKEASSWVVELVEYFIVSVSVISVTPGWVTVLVSGVFCQGCPSLSPFAVSVPLSQDSGTTGSTMRRYSRTCSGEVVCHITEPFRPQRDRREGNMVK